MTIHRPKSLSSVSKRRKDLRRRITQRSRKETFCSRWRTLRSMLIRSQQAAHWSTNKKLKALLTHFPIADLFRRQKWAPIVFQFWTSRKLNLHWHLKRQAQLKYMLLAVLMCTALINQKAVQVTLSISTSCRTCSLIASSSVEWYRLVEVLLGGASPHMRCEAWIIRSQKMSKKDTLESHQIS